MRKMTNRARQKFELSINDDEFNRLLEARIDYKQLLTEQVKLDGSSAASDEQGNLRTVENQSDSRVLNVIDTS